MSIGKGKRTGLVKFRDGPRVIDSIVKVPDFEFPPKYQLSYLNPIVGFMHYYDQGVNVIMKDGRKS
jgi:hypothetical protein